MNFYVTTETTDFPCVWLKVLAGPFTDKESLKDAMLKEIRAANSFEEATIVSQMVIAATTKKINVNKSIRGDWLEGSYSFTRKIDNDITEAYEKMRKEFFIYD